MGWQYNNILLSDIDYDSTCLTVIPNGFPISLACENSKTRFDMYLKKSSVQSNKKQQRSIVITCVGNSDLILAEKSYNNRRSRDHVQLNKEVSRNKNNFSIRIF